ncbi:integumentary mucin C.1-like [Drosophila teissieri]|uniref:integumentary mucin C.1-like n=1 Tax=Drosophila teissieri TaxID=7243 RepID=UPI001CBA120D|nr:integumentary mucin C.1-like [Drosophila teissieri]
MRATTIISAILVLSACLLRSSEAVTCTADATVAGCINCTTSPTDAECVAEAAAAATTTTTTVAPTSTTVATTTAAPSSASGTGTGSRKIVRVSNLRYSVNRRIRINPTTSRSTGRTGRRSTNTNSNTNRNRRRRKNSGGRRGNARVVVG